MTASGALSEIKHGAIPADGYTKKDFSSDQEVRWCPGCGDFQVLAQVQKLFPDLGIPRENFVVVSGIGCSSRFPYYMHTYGFHSIHGRAPAVATGVKMTRPDLSVWVMTGDGDALSIGGNHLLHAMRRNMDLNIVLFNNEIYGLTKGQVSPTSRRGTVTKSSPQGSVETPLHPISIAIAAGATFVARAADNNTKHLLEVLRAAAEHRGTAFVEVLQNCHIFNDGVFEDHTHKKVREEREIFLEHGKPIVYGAEQKKGIRLNGLELEEATIGENGVTEDDILIHDMHADNSTLAYFLGRLEWPAHPVAMGVFRAIKAPTYEMEVIQQRDEAEHSRGIGDIEALLHSGDVWEVTEEDEATHPV